MTSQACCMVIPITPHARQICMITLTIRVGASRSPMCLAWERGVLRYVCDQAESPARKPQLAKRQLKIVQEAIPEAVRMIDFA
jgi:hypothetical protein